MEKIKLMDEKELKDWYFNDKEQPTIKELILELYVWGNKINEIIDWISKYEPHIIDLIHEETRLKTLEEDNDLQKKMIKFIMENSSKLKMYNGEITYGPLQDFWDEKNEEHLIKVGDSVNVISSEQSSYTRVPPKDFTWTDGGKCKPTVKDNWRCGKCEIEESGYQSGESIPEHSIHCKKRNEPTDNSEKIEEIISGIDKFLYWSESGEYKSWLRDKLKGL